MKVLIVVLILWIAVGSGCARAVKVAAGAGKVAGVEARAAQAANKGRALVVAHTRNLYPDEEWTVVQTACAANDLVDVARAPNLTEAVKGLVSNFGPLHARIQGLAEDLREASTLEERQSRGGVFVVCESA